MLKRTLLLICLFIVAFLFLVETTARPFPIITTMAQQIADSHPRGNSDPENKEIGKKSETDTQNNNQSDKNNNSVKPEQPKEDPQESPLAFENTTLIDKNGKQIVTNVDSLLVLVNKNRNIPADYIPKDMVIPDVAFAFAGDSPKKYLREEAASALEGLFQGAQDAGLDLLATSGYRSYETQKALFENKARALGEEEANRTSAYPGQSEHQTGLAMDITCTQASFGLSEGFGELEEGIWVKENAHKYGFIIRYPKGKEDITGYSYEPWHLRFVGKETAGYIYDKGITLEEYFAQVYNY